MSFQFIEAKREQVGLLIGLAGASGSGKTFSALRLATAISEFNGGDIAFLDTEARRGLHYSDRFKFLHCDMTPPFRPARFVEAIKAAEDTGAGVIVIDSFSHEYDGEGGVIDWADELERGGTKSPANWIKPKQGHKKLVGALLQCRATVIFCLRADEKVEVVKDERGKTVVRPIGWQPICEKRFMYEMTASFTLRPDRPGALDLSLPHKLQDQHRGFFVDGKVIDETAGRLIAEWARGGQAPKAPEVNSQSADDEREDADDPDAEALLKSDNALAEAAISGTEALKAAWASLPKSHQHKLKIALDRRHKPSAMQADAAIDRTGVDNE